MWAIISDNITIVDILRICKNKSKNSMYRSNCSFRQYLYALVLWDAIYISSSRESVSRSEHKLITSAYKDPFLKNIGNTINELPFRYSERDINTVISHIYGKANITRSNDLIANAALYYLALGQVANMNIMLSQERAKFVQYSGMSSKLWSREYILEYVDQKVFEIYKDIYSFFGQDIVHIQTPLLVDYICQNATCAQDAVNTALQLRETTEMIQFREAMNCLDDAFNEGNLLLINSIKQQMGDIIEQFAKKEISTDKLTISLSFTPSFTSPSLSAEIGIPIDCNRASKHIISLGFINNLVRHGLTKTYRNN